MHRQRCPFRLFRRVELMRLQNAQICAIIAVYKANKNFVRFRLERRVTERERDGESMLLVE